jgi:hypothetical protein
VSQLSFFSAEALPPSLDDLEGLLAGPGQVTSSEAGARVSVLLSEPWRSLALLDALEQVGLSGEVVAVDGEGLVVRTPYLSALRPLAERWTSGAVKLPPPGLVLDGPRLRWWCLAAGRHDAQGYVLRLGEHDEEAWQALGAALSAAGLAAVYLPDGAGGPAYKVVGVKRLRRLAELVGPPPADAPEGAWPTA